MRMLYEVSHVSVTVLLVIEHRRNFDEKGDDRSFLIAMLLHSDHRCLCVLTVL